MTRRSRALAALLGLLIATAVAAQTTTGEPQESVPPEEPGPPPLPLSLSEAIQTALNNNLDIKVATYNPQLRGQDTVVQEAVFDPNLSFSATKEDNSRPSQNVFDVGTSGAVVSVDSTVNFYTAAWQDPLQWGANYTAELNLGRFTSTSANAVFPTTYTTSLTLAYNQSLLRNFGKPANTTEIVVARNNQKFSESQFHQQVLTVLKLTEDAYWELVFARQDLDVKKESLRLAEELLKLNRIKVQVGTLPPIEITQAEAEVANREQGVIVAENAVYDAEDALRRVLNMPKDSDAWSRRVVPSDEPAYLEREVDFDKELQEAIDNRPDMVQARLNIQNADTRLAFQRNQLKWDLNFRAAYTLQGLSGDATPQAIATIFCDDSGLDGIPATGDPGEGDGICDGGQPPTPTFPGGQPGENRTFLFSEAINQNFLDAGEQIRDRDFESWSVGASLDIPIGNNAAQARYVGARLTKEQEDIRYQSARLNAEILVRNAGRGIITNKKRIDAAAKNVELQRKKVEAEQKKFENGMSTSFQVLDFQEDLTTALGAQNRALVDYRKSLTALEDAKGTLDRYLNVRVQ